MPSNLDRVAELIRDLFDEYDGPIAPELTAAEVPQWDSLGHVQLMVLIEQTFGIRFSAGEVGKFRNLAELLDAIEQKTVAKV